ncbi:lipopolysaccharide biosynthesis protein [Pseudomonas sp. MDT2-39-1]
MYGLLSATIGYALYVVGFEFYNFSTREMIGEDSKHWLGMIRDQLVLYLILYVVFLPFALFVFFKGWLPWTHVFWFLGLALLEHIAQELNRILVAISEQLLASFVLFLRSGAWCLAVVAIMWADPALRNLEFVLGGWVLGCLFACLIAVRKILSFDKTSIASAVNWVWIARGIKVAIPLLIASLAMRGVFTFDRYWVESISNLSVLGSYVLFVGMASAVLSFLDAGVIVFFYPKLVASAKNGNLVAFKKDMKDLTFNIVGVTAFLVAACYGVSGFVLQWLDNSVYTENIFILYWLLLAVTIYSVSMIPHLGLYAFGHDKAISYSQLIGFFVFLGFAYSLGDKLGVVAIPLAMCVAFTLILGWKLISYWSMLSVRGAST